MQSRRKEREHVPFENTDDIPFSSLPPKLAPPQKAAAQFPSPSNMFTSPPGHAQHPRKEPPPMQHEPPQQEFHSYHGQPYSKYKDEPRSTFPPTTSSTSSESIRYPPEHHASNYAPTASSTTSTSTYGYSHSHPSLLSHPRRSPEKQNAYGASFGPGRQDPRAPPPFHPYKEREDNSFTPNRTPSDLNGLLSVSVWSFYFWHALTCTHTLQILSPKEIEEHYLAEARAKTASALASLQRWKQ